MAKPKQKEVGAVSGNKKGTTIDCNLQGEDSWVMVKLQRVTILIPTAPHPKKSAMSKPGSSEPEAMPMKTVDNESTVPMETSTRMPSVDNQAIVMQLVPHTSTEMATKTPAQHSSALHKLPKANITTRCRNSNQVNAHKFHDLLQVSNFSKTIKQPRLVHGPGSLLDRGMLLNQRLRASLLERKLQKAGGLSRWLASLGLEQFVRIFRGKNVSKFQLVNLTMKKLKDMGADAVGPRRKLMHAIDCICQPCCFEVH